MNQIITRFAPSPTGNLHSGAYRTAIFSYLFARKNNGKFILRIEDTDTERSKTEYQQNIEESLQWLGLEFDAFFTQSEHRIRHTEILEKMITDGHAYISKELAKDGSGIMKEIIRFKNPNSEVTFHDEIKGMVTMNTSDLGDFVIAKNINEPLFHLAVVIDDYDSGVTHIIRGEDHVSNTPRQILIQRAIGAPTPIYAHLPLVLGLDKQKLSKRKGALAITEYRDLGYLPQAILNMVAMIGWNPGTEQELFTKKELIETFDLAQVQKSPAVFNPEKLNWFNREYIKLLSHNEKKSWIVKFLPESLQSIPNDMLDKLIPVMTERIDYFGQITEFANAGEYDYYIYDPEFPIENIIWKTDTLDQAKIHLEKVRSLIINYSGDWTIDAIKSIIWDYAESVGRGSVLWPMRYALSGREKSPDPFTLAFILGKETVIKRLDKVINLL
jgi:glutamyl-tRNA synthetase